MGRVRPVGSRRSRRASPRAAPVTHYLRLGRTDGEYGSDRGLPAQAAPTLVVTAGSRAANRGRRGASTTPSTPGRISGDNRPCGASINYDGAVK